MTRGDGAVGVDMDNTCRPPRFGLRNQSIGLNSSSSSSATQFTLGRYARLSGAVGKNGTYSSSESRRVGRLKPMITA